MFLRNTITFIEKHASKDELEVAQTVRAYHKGLQIHDNKLLLAQLTDDANIYSFAAGGKVVSKENYAKAIDQNITNKKTSVVLKDLRIVIETDDCARVSGFHQYSLARKTSRVRTIELLMKKHDEHWRIASVNYFDL